MLWSVVRVQKKDQHKLSLEQKGRDERAAFVLTETKAAGVESVLSYLRKVVIIFVASPVKWRQSFDVYENH